MKKSEFKKILEDKLMRFHVDEYSVPGMVDEVMDLLEKYKIRHTIKSKEVKPENYSWGSDCTMRCVCEECDPEFPVHAWIPE